MRKFLDGLPVRKDPLYAPAVENTEVINADACLAPATWGAQEERAQADERVSGRMPLCTPDSPHNDGRDAWTKAVGNIETASGMRYDFCNPDPDTVILEDIAHALSNVCRFAGQIRRFNSVAEHSVLASEIVEARGGVRYQQAAALLHDGHEAYIWDAPSPLKPLLGDIFKELADIADAIIARKFLTPMVAQRGGTNVVQPVVGAAVFTDPIIKAADYTALVVEARGLLPVGPTDDEWEPLPKGVHWNGGLTPYEAKALFLKRADELGLRPCP